MLADLQRLTPTTWDCSMYIKVCSGTTIFSEDNGDVLGEA